jgi:hypothetical protein
LESDRLRHLGLVPPRLILGPILRQIEPISDRQAAS